MEGSEEFLCVLLAFGRSHLQDFVARSRNVSYVSTYLLAELNLELARVTSFMTMDLVTFERKEVFSKVTTSLSTRNLQLSKGHNPPSFGGRNR
jgi:hypothetical protein